jgi:hypothetical protein
MWTRLRRFRRGGKNPRFLLSGGSNLNKEKSRSFNDIITPSKATFLTTDLTSSSETDSVDSSCLTSQSGKVVRFNTDIHEIFYIEACNEMSLWWTNEELEHIRSTCSQVIENCGEEGIHEIAEALSDYLSMGFVQESVDGAATLLRVMSTYEDTRGLEHCCTEERQAAIQDHRYMVLSTQALVTSMHSPKHLQSNLSESLRIASLRVSKATESLAYRKAQYDKRAAFA